MGVVYGDIGTSPLYTMKEVFNGPHAVAVTPDNLLGILSLIFWALTITVSLKYVMFITRADNRGEGGIMALTSLALRSQGAGPRMLWLMSILGIFGAGLFYGDAVITPAMSVLSAIEGLEVATPMFKPYIVPISIGVLCGLFFFQPRGTPASAHCSDRSCCSGSARWACWASGTFSSIRRRSPRSTRGTRCISSWKTAATPGSPWVRWCWRSPAAKRFMPTWDTSAGARSNGHGWATCFPACT
jgi:hypothetical protein